MKDYHHNSLDPSSDYKMSSSNNHLQVFMSQDVFPLSISQPRSVALGNVTVCKQFLARIFFFPFMKEASSNEAFHYYFNNAQSEKLSCILIVDSC